MADDDGSARRRGGRDLVRPGARMGSMWVGTAVLLLAAQLVLTGCGESSQRSAADPGRPAASGGGTAPAVVADCAAQDRLAHAPLPGESGVYRAGPVLVSLGQDLAQNPVRGAGRSHVSEAIVTVLGGGPAILRVLPSPGARMRLEFGAGFGRSLADGRRSLRFPTCGRAVTRFRGGVVFTGRGCARLEAVTGAGAALMRIPIAGSLHGCGDGSRAPGLRSGWAPFLGVACGQPDWAGCDRIGIGVWAQRPATVVMVRVGGRLVTLSPPGPGDRAQLWQGYLYGDGPAHGALTVRSGPRHAWSGTPELHPRAQVLAVLADGRLAVGTPMRALLHPGFG